MGFSTVPSSVFFSFSLLLLPLFSFLVFFFFSLFYLFPLFFLVLFSVFCFCFISYLFFSLFCLVSFQLLPLLSLGATDLEEQGFILNNKWRQHRERTKKQTTIYSPSSSFPSSPVTLMARGDEGVKVVIYVAVNNGVVVMMMELADVDDSVAVVVVVVTLMLW